MDETIRQCFSMRADAEELRQKAAGLERSYEERISQLTKTLNILAENPEEFAAKNPVLKSLYQDVARMVKNTKGEWVKPIESWILLGDLMEEELERINSYAGCRTSMEYQYSESDDNYWHTREQKGIIVRAGLEKMSIWGFGPCLITKNDKGEEEQHYLRDILKCSEFKGYDLYRGLGRMTVYTKMLEGCADHERSVEICFPSSGLITASKIAEDAMEIYLKQKMNRY